VFGTAAPSSSIRQLPCALAVSEPNGVSATTSSRLALGRGAVAVAQSTKAAPPGSQIASKPERPTVS
jgi:hypothetical protein